TAQVARRELYRKIRTIGRVGYNESLMSHIHTEFSGWVQKAYVNTTGEKVIRGEKLVDIYSPQLVTAQQEYLDAYKSVKNVGVNTDPAVRKNLETIRQSSRIRLEYFDISDEQITTLEQTGKVKKTVSIQSPFTGYVVEKHLTDGMEVKPGMRMYNIADLTTIWVYADIYEYELPWLATNQKARMTLSYLPGESFKGTVDYIYPYLESKSRTVKARLVVPNKHMMLKPGMYANVEIQSSPVKNAVAVPLEAVLFSGERSLVFVALGGGRFAPRDVVVGIESGDGYYQIKSGLQEGETIVLSGQFLLDSESRLQEGIAKMLEIRKSAKASQDKTKTDMPNLNKADDETVNMQMDTNHTSANSHEHTATQPVQADQFGTVGDDELTYYTCPMEIHAFVKVNHPGDCPECGMKLVKKTIKYDSTKTWYTCPMPSHSYVVEDHPGKCPVCDMTLVPIKNQQD
ncbi:MAG: efflux RND transporter periplasmic adaptor subunit, partial [Candidatus Marinimicrobia bacterium]|nr:efflux RND transporter periplasmic adaptor subunit [Candidatus Neomarinimicrobiota bacterium]